jgi:hypothetical protein
MHIFQYHPSYHLVSMDEKKEIKNYFFKWFGGDQLPPSITSVISLNENPQGTRMIKLLLSQCRAKMLDDMTFIIDKFFLQMTMEWKTMNINVI